MPLCTKGLRLGMYEIVSSSGNHSTPCQNLQMYFQIIVILGTILVHSSATTFSFGYDLFCVPNSYNILTILHGNSTKYSPRPFPPNKNRNLSLSIY